MAVEEIAGAYVLAPTLKTPPRVADPQHWNNPYKVLMDRALLPAGSEVDSIIRVAQLKPGAVLSALGFIGFAALGASTTLSLGIEDDVELGISGKEALLISAVSSASAGTASAIAAVAIANRYKPLWELAGLAAEPTKNLNLIITLAGATSAAGGVVAWEIPFTSY